MPLDRDGFGFDSLISSDGAEKLLQKGFDKISNFSFKFGIAVAQLLGYYMVWYLISHFVRVGINAFQIRHIAGWGIHLIFSLFTHLANLFIQRRVDHMARNQHPHRVEHPERAGLRRAFSNLYLNAGQVADNRDIVLVEAGGVAPIPEPRVQ